MEKLSSNTQNMGSLEELHSAETEARKEVERINVAAHLEEESKINESQTHCDSRWQNQLNTIW